MSLPSQDYTLIGQLWKGREKGLREHSAPLRSSDTNVHLHTGKGNLTHGLSKQ